jgi:hypothetical protein
MMDGWMILRTRWTGDEEDPQQKKYTVDLGVFIE